MNGIPHMYYVLMRRLHELCVRLRRELCGGQWHELCGGRRRELYSGQRRARLRSSRLICLRPSRLTEAFGRAFRRDGRRASRHLFSRLGNITFSRPERVSRV
ncbi:MAG: hypothetical protein M3444_23430 [Acidobacteriota bacterium]|nr:hypothetical protein [Acidobacteriota bacterium]